MRDPIKARARRKRWVLLNPEKDKASRNKWRAQTRAHRTRVTREWSRKNRDVVRASSQKWYGIHGAKYYKEYRKANPQVARLTKYRRRALEKNAAGTFTFEQFIGRCEVFGWKCRYCSSALNVTTVTLDHQIPLSRGGSNWLSNLVPACKLCNVRKHNKMPHDFITSTSAQRRDNCLIGDGRDGLSRYLLADRSLCAT